jgi:hypothetical protein
MLSHSATPNHSEEPKNEADQNDGRCDLMKPEKSAELPKDNFDLGTQ